MRGSEVLEQKRSTLLRERLRLAEELTNAAADWERKARAASTWNARAAAAAGPRSLRLAALQGGRATVTVTHRNVIGVVVPAAATVERGAAPEGGAAVRLAAEAHADALAAATVLAVLEAAHEAIDAELRRTVRRLRAIEHRWIPEHETALRKLQLTLDEAELADVARTRWAAGRAR